MGVVVSLNSTIVTYDIVFRELRDATRPISRLYVDVTCVPLSVSELAIMHSSNKQ